MRKHLRFFFNDTATTEIYTLSLHDALPIFTQTVLESRMRRVLAEALSEHLGRDIRVAVQVEDSPAEPPAAPAPEDRKSTRLNSSHANISYAVFCLKKKKL